MVVEGPIFLTGFMGTGKSRVGRTLAAHLGWDFIDTDRMIEARTGRTIAEIFNASGEAEFRQVEHECVALAAGRSDAVIALGGGALTQERNWQLIRKAGVVVALKADVETILERVGRRDDRPLLAGLNQEEKRARVRDMLADRARFYERADLEVWTDNEQAPEATAEKIIELAEQWCAVHRRRT